jgi:hypothetical protein
MDQRVCGDGLLLQTHTPLYIAGNLTLGFGFTSQIPA